jgi:hypothetical protein
MSQNINLYDASLRVRQDPLGLDAVLAATAVALLLVGLCTAYAQVSLARTEPLAEALSTELRAQQAAMQAVATESARIKPDAALQAEIGNAQRALLQRRAALLNLDAGAAGAETGFSTRLEALARQSVDGLWLTGLTLRQDDVLLRGRATNPALIPTYVQRLEREPTLQGRSFKALDVVRPLDGATDRPAPTGAEAAPAPRAEFVEFTLTGPGILPTPVADKGAKP